MLIASKPPSLRDLLDRLKNDGVDPKEVLKEIAANQQGKSSTTVAQLCHALGERYLRLINGTGTDDDYEQVAVGWFSAAAKLGHFDSATRLAKLRRGNPAYWHLTAFSIGLKEVESSDSADQATVWTERLMAIIRELFDADPDRGNRCLRELLSCVVGHAKLQLDAAPLRELDREMRPWEPSVQVLTRIAPSADRAVKSHCELYKDMTLAPTPLMPIPDAMELLVRLDGEFPWCRSVTDWLSTLLAARRHGDNILKFPPILLVGPPGIGKTSYVMRAAELLGAPFRLLSLSGAADNRSLAGTSRGWGTGHPSQILELIREVGYANPVVVLDELDKAGGSDRNGRIHDTLLTMLEPSSARAFHDEYLWAPLDLSYVNFFATANEYRFLPTPLLDRFKVMTIPAPGRSDYAAIVQGCVKAYLSRNGINPGWIGPLDSADWAWLERFFKSPRLVRKAVESLLSRKLNAAPERCH